MIPAVSHAIQIGFIDAWVSGRPRVKALRVWNSPQWKAVLHAPGVIINQDPEVVEEIHRLGIPVARARMEQYLALCFDSVGATMIRIACPTVWIMSNLDFTRSWEFCTGLAPL